MLGIAAGAAVSAARAGGRDNQEKSASITGKRKSEKDGGCAAMLEGVGGFSGGAAGIAFCGGSAGFWTATLAGAFTPSTGGLPASLGAAGAGASTFPRIIGSLSFPPPIITILEFVLCES